MNPPAIKQNSFLCTLRNFLVLAITIGLMLERFGIPYLRVSYTYNETHGTRSYLSSRYWSVTGSRFLHGDNQPVVLFMPLDKPVTHYVKACSILLWRQISTPSSKP